MTPPEEATDCGFHRGDGLAHPCCSACDVLGCWHERPVLSYAEEQADIIERLAAWRDATGGPTDV